jgi:hypothetical protein
MTTNIWKKLKEELDKPSAAEMEIVAILKASPPSVRDDMLDEIQIAWGGDATRRTQDRLGAD